MKKLIFVIFTCVVLSFSDNSQVQNAKSDFIVPCNTAMICKLQSSVGSGGGTVLVIDTLSYFKNNDSLVVLKKQIDSLRTELFLAQYKINKIQYYVNICKRNPSQKVFLMGWLNRTLASK